VTTWTDTESSGDLVTMWTDTERFGDLVTMWTDRDFWESCDMDRQSFGDLVTWTDRVFGIL
jgi:hypothetical protein